VSVMVENLPPTNAIARGWILSNLLLGVDNHTQLMSGSKQLYLAMVKILAESSVILLR